jgi:hypothetical protein
VFVNSTRDIEENVYASNANEAPDEKTRPSEGWDQAYPDKEQVGSSPDGTDQHHDGSEATGAKPTYAGEPCQGT